MDIRLIVSDIDGTLLRTGEPVPAVTAEAIRACRARGVEFAVASGRWFPAAREVVAGQLGIEDGYLIVCNGGAVMRGDGAVLMERCMTREQAEAVYALFRQEPVTCTCYARGAIYRLHMERLHVFTLPERSGYFGGSAYNVIDEDFAAFERLGLGRAYKLEAYSDDPAPLARLRAKLEALHLRVNSAFPFDLEVMAPDAGKGAATRWLTERLGLRRDQVMGFGDYLNDLPMLEAVGYPVAVGNAIDEVKRACRIVAPSCEDGGVGWAIQKYVLGGEAL